MSSSRPAYRPLSSAETCLMRQFRTLREFRYPGTTDPSPHAHQQRKPKPKILSSILEHIGETPLVRINKITQQEGVTVGLTQSFIRYPHCVHMPANVGPKGPCVADESPCTSSARFWPNVSSSTLAVPSKTALACAWSRYVVLQEGEGSNVFICLQ